MNIGPLELLGAAMAEVLMARNMQKSSLGLLDALKCRLFARNSEL